MTAGRRRVAVLAALAAALATAAAATPEARGAGAADALLDRLRVACETRADLRGIRLRSGTLDGGALVLAGTVDAKAQADALEAEAARLLKEEPRWRAEIPGGVKAGGLAEFPIRSAIRRRLQGEFAGAAAGKDGRPGLLQQTRLDDLYFDRAGRLRAAGLCVARRAFARRGGDAIGEIGRGLRDRLRAVPIPAGVDPAVFDDLQVDGIRFEEDPARVLQRRACRTPGADDAILLDARFDADGRLVLDGSVGPAGFDPGPGRDALRGLLLAPAFVRAYGRPDANVAEGDADAALAGLRRYDWRPGLIAALRERCARPSGPDGAPGFRHCRFDGAAFDYGDAGVLVLRFDGRALDPAEAEAVVPKVRAWAAERLRFGRPVDYDLEVGLARPVASLAELLGALRGAVADRPALDGVRVDDVVFGPAGEAVVEGAWAGADQSAALVETAGLALGGAVGDGPVVPRMATIPARELLRALRAQVETAPTLDETSLDRLYFRPIAGGPPAATLRATALASRREAAAGALAGWIAASETARRAGLRPEVAFGPDRPASALVPLWRMVESEPALDGVRVDRLAFDADNRLVVTCQQEAPGQLDPGPTRDDLLRKVALAAGEAWTGLPTPTATLAVTRTAPVRAIFDAIVRRLPSFPEADGVLLRRAGWRDHRTLVFRGFRSGPIDEPALTRRLLGLATGYASVALDLKESRVDPDRCRHVQAALIRQLAEGRIAEATLEIVTEIVYGAPRDSANWYLRAAFHSARGDGEACYRDMERALQIEANDATGAAGRSRRARLAGVVGSWKATLDAIEGQAQRRRLAR